MRIDEDKIPVEWPFEPEPGFDVPRSAEPESDDELAKLARGIAHPARIRILRALDKKGDLAVWEIMREVPLAQSTVSAHLRALRRAGLVQSSRFPPMMVYEVVRPTLRRLKTLLARL